MNATMPKVIMSNDGFALDWRFGVIKGSSTNTCIHVFSFLLAKHRETQPSSAKLLLPYYCNFVHCTVVDIVIM